MSKLKVLRPLKAMREHCLECSCGSSKAVLWCPIVDCTLWPYRFGARPQSVRQKHGGELLSPERFRAVERVDLDSLPGGADTAAEFLAGRTAA